MKRIRLGLLPRIIIAIALGVAAGNILPLPLVRLFVTFNSIFSQFLGFIIPLIIVGLVTPAIADIGKTAGKLLVATVAIAYIDTVLCGLLAYGTGSILFPSMVEGQAQLASTEKAAEILPFFTVNIPAMIDVMSALVLSFVCGLGIAYMGASTLKKASCEFGEIITRTIEKAIIPLLPLYIFGIFTNMTYTGEAYRIMAVFAQIICVIFALHIIILLYQYCVAGAFARSNPLRMLWRMLPAYFTALGTSSSAATIPVTLKQTELNGVNKGIAGFVIPLCATIHLSGSVMKITACALTICMLEGIPHDFSLFVYFIMLLSIMMVAAPGVPGGAIMASLATLASILGFGTEEQALMIALYIAMDSFGTACNVTGDGAIAIVMDKMFPKAKENAAA
ncbi:MAG: dicarboxylate/amino acid:cation symporter [Prevotellaceae bacterium]|nr:dicarboxylate/amino acid:cation symporter [Prevotellaceae bacterium]